MGRVGAVAVRLGEYLVALRRECAGQRFTRGGADRDVHRDAPETWVSDPPSGDVLCGCIEPGTRPELDDLRRVRRTVRLRLGPRRGGDDLGFQRRLGLCRLVLPRESVVLPSCEPEPNCCPDGKRREPAARSGAAFCAASPRRGVWFLRCLVLPCRKQLAPGLARFLSVPVAIFECHSLNLNSCP
jgi:hypothetical protein